VDAGPRGEAGREVPSAVDAAAAPGTTEYVSSLGLAWQPSLFGSVGSDVDQSFRALRRVELDDASWVDHCPGWMAGSDDAFEQLVRNLAWNQRRRWMYDREVDEPRLTWWQKVDERQPLDLPLLESARTVLGDHYGIAFDSVGVNLYRDGSDSVAWHRDRIPKEIVDPVVALVSLGVPRTFLLRAKGGGPSRSFKLGQGDLLVTGGQTQRRFEHSVPKVASSGPRISVAFRYGVR
jgi:alkylated DNA repair dioxygenase AlkB